MENTDLTIFMRCPLAVHFGRHRTSSEETVKEIAPGGAVMQMTNLAFENWKFRESIALAWILNSSTAPIVAQLTSHTSATSVWKYLADSYAAKSTACRNGGGSFCQLCGKQGHRANTCYRFVGSVQPAQAHLTGPDSLPQYLPPSSPPSALTSSAWFVDLGATHHVMDNSAGLTRVNHIQVKLSLLWVTASPYRSPTQEILRGVLDNGLYRVILPSCHSSTPSASVASLTLWHNRFGHATTDRLVHLLNSSNISFRYKGYHCYCPKDKRFYVVADAIFDEAIYPLAATPNSSQNVSTPTSVELFLPADLSLSSSTPAGPPESSRVSPSNPDVPLVDTTDTATEPVEVPQETPATVPASFSHPMTTRLQDGTITRRTFKRNHTSALVVQSSIPEEPTCFPRLQRMRNGSSQCSVDT
ncbi:hypothetical protein NL676_019634 [Syzygium grande]|nr:hypothetical protein NL676_019634 [Syzygium grande]